MRKEYSGFANLEGITFNGQFVIGSLVQRNPVKWQVSCRKCGSRWNDVHQNLTNANQFYACKNANCRLNGIENLKRELDPESKPEPVGIPALVPKGNSRYELYRDYMQKNGFADRDIASLAEWDRIGYESQQGLLKPALLQEEASVRRKELEALSEAMQQADYRRIRNTYGNY